jgi:hydroxyethylthiazole kinase-like uncharacterized protein yjeF
VFARDDMVLAMNDPLRLTSSEAPAALVDPGPELLSTDEMYRADALAIESGIPGVELMANAGAAVAEAIRSRWRPRPTVVLCGPGNNGGDGFVVARILDAAGWPVRLALTCPPERLKGDAAAHAAHWTGTVEAVEPAAIGGAGLVVDALFGAGLERPLDGAIRATVEALADSRAPVVAVDVPSGVHGDTGQVMGTAVYATLTVTFFRKKPGHVLLPGRLLSGQVLVADIGIPIRVLDSIAPATRVNGPELWRSSLRWPSLLDNKYTRGHAVVAGGARMTGAARMAARAAQRIGAGLVTVTAPREAHWLYSAALESALVVALDDADSFAEVLSDRRKNAVLVGPGNGVHETTRSWALAALEQDKATVLDADAITVFRAAPEVFFNAIRGPCVLTPHEGEFTRLFAFKGSKLLRTRQAAAISGAVLVLKGGDTVVAAPDGRAAISTNAPASLATAGAGDVLAGMITGLLAQGVPAFEAAAAAVWMHGDAAADFGPGLIAEDLPELLPKVLARLRARA